MQIVISVGEEGQPGARVVSAEPAVGGAPVSHPGVAMDAGAAPALEAGPQVQPSAAAGTAEAGTYDGGAAPPELREPRTEQEEEGRAATGGRQWATRPEPRAYEDAGAAPTIVDVFPVEPGSTPRG